MKSRLKNKLSPTQIIALGFFITILLGSFLLKLPISHEGEITYFDALFVSTSATCVTGHTTVDVATTFTTFGQFIIMSLIQIGGLGFALVIALILMWIGKKISFKNRILVSQSVNKTDFSGISKLLRKIIKYTLTFELFGALILATRLVPEYGWGDGLFKSLFHAISSFCNAGFDTFLGDSLIPYAQDKAINITLMVLITIGGLGFLVWEDIATCIGNAIREKSSIIRAIKKFSLHTKLVLIMQIVLVFGGALVFLLLEYDNELTIGELDASNKVLVSFFQSVSSRTAGMASTSMMSLRDSTKMIMIFLMFIGGAPGSMAGGIKTVTLVVILYGIITLIKGKKNITILKRTISRETYEKAYAIMTFMIVLIYVSMIITMCNLVVGTNSLDVLFDMVSALATVGLSTGALENMNMISKSIIILLMYLGRVGTITTAVAFMINKPKENDDIVYAKENVIVG